MGRVFAKAYAPSTLGSFLRAFTFGHVRQLDAVASRFLTGLAGQAPLLRPGEDEFVLVDVDDTLVEVHGYAKQGAGFGYTGVRGLNALLATATTPGSAPLARADSPFYGRGLVVASVRAGADVSVTVRMGKVRTAIAGIPEETWEPIEYTDAVYDEQAGRWISRAEVAEVGFTAFSAQKKADQVPGRLVEASSDCPLHPEVSRRADRRTGRGVERL